jgi:CDP-glucose 4,6-dehydratase
MGLVNLLEAIRRCDSVRAVVIVTSDKCYENNEWLWAYRETEALGGRDPYSNSKACAELVTRAYRDSYFIPRGGPGVATARAGNVIGGGDWSPDRLVPDIITAIANREPAQLRSPDAIRPWQHVFEPLAGYLLLAQRLMEDPLRYSGAWNFGPDETDLRTVGELADALLAAAGQPPVWRQTTLAAPHEAHTLRVDSSKAHRLLGWRPRLDIATALGLTASWYAAWLDGKAMREESDAQLAAYRSAVPALSN